MEVHVRLKTRTKLFCGCPADQEGQPPNTVVCPICMGYPGSKPRLNREAVTQALKVALALGCRVSPVARFSRKTYFYPDMSKNFQITQFEEPLATGGGLEVKGSWIGIRRVQLEEDPARLVHLGGSGGVNIDYNRSGLPLVEIVTEPAISSTEMAREFLKALALTLEHIGVYDPRDEASLRVDANVSVEGGARVEVKNITGYRNVERALGFEVVRQTSALNMGVRVERETRHFDAATGTTVPLRAKELEEDYGYIAEPDLTQIHLSEEVVARVRAAMPELPRERVQRFAAEYGLPRRQAEIIVQEGLQMSRFFEECCRLYPSPRRVANWITTFLLKSLNYEGLRVEESRVQPHTFVELLELIDEGVISERLAKELIKDYVATGKSPRALVREKGLGLLPREEVRAIVREVLEQQGKAVEDYRGGRVKALDFLLGQVLRRARARAPVSLVREVLLEELEG